MNGSAFGALADGLMGGYNMGKIFKPKATTTPMTPEAQKSSEAGSTKAGYSGDLSGFTPGKPGAAEAASSTEQPSMWSKITGFLTPETEPAQKNPLAAGIGQITGGGQ